VFVCAGILPVVKPTDIEEKIFNTHFKNQPKEIIMFNLNKISLFLSSILVTLIYSTSALAITPGSGWEDSYSANGKCYCASTFDHDIGGILVDTPAGKKTVREICTKIGAGPGKKGNPIYNDIQCGNGPINNAGDEKLCPGRVDMGSAGCSIIGPKWDLSVYTNGGGNTTPGQITNIPGKIEAENYANYYDQTAGNSGNQYRTQNVDIESTSDQGNGYNVGWIDGGEWLEFPIKITQSGQYKAVARVASLPGNGMFTLELDGRNLGQVFNVAATGSWQNWISMQTDIGFLAQGNATLRFQVQASGFNLNWIELVRISDGTSSTPSSASSSSSPNTIDQCNTTQQCKNIFGAQATDCKNSQSVQSVCMCGTAACR
jgi:hypothetical protein